MLGSRVSGPALAALLTVVCTAFLAPRNASAQCGGFEDLVSTSVRVSRLTQNIDSAIATGHPAFVDFGHSFVFPDFADLGGRGILAFDNGGVSARMFAGGWTQTEFGSNNVRATAFGTLFDCLTLSGGTGSAQIHLPFHLEGASATEWVLNGGNPNYPPGATPASSNFEFLCFVSDYGVAPPAPVPCADFNWHWSTNVSVDEDGEIVFNVLFDRPHSLNLKPTLISGLSYVGLSTEGQLVGSSSALVSLAFGPAYVTDLGGNPLPSALITSTSGYDYTNPVPVPESPVELAGTAALAGVLALRRRRMRAPSR